EIAIIDHVDIDRVSGEALAACAPAAVINIAASISGRYPNMGPRILVEAGVPLVDNASPELLERVAEGDVIRLHDGMVYRGDELVGKGEEQTAETIDAAMAEAR